MRNILIIFSAIVKCQFLKVYVNEFPSRNGPFPQSLRQSAELIVRRTNCTPPHNSLISLTLRKIAHF